MQCPLPKLWDLGTNSAPHLQPPGMVLRIKQDATHGALRQVGRGEGWHGVKAGSWRYHEKLGDKVLDPQKVDTSFRNRVSQKF